jgi:Holin of 3TMs, for gene-transfer release
LNVAALTKPKLRFPTSIHIGYFLRSNFAKERIVPFLANLIGPIAGLIDKIIPDPAARDAAKLELLRAEGSQELAAIQTQMSAIIAEASSSDPWTSRARPSFLYVMYALLLWSIPMGLLAAIRPEAATAIASGMNAYLTGIPEPLYALFGTGYIGYTAARTWGKIRGVE